MLGSWLARYGTSAGMSRNVFTSVVVMSPRSSIGGRLPTLVDVLLIALADVLQNLHRLGRRETGHLDVQIRANGMLPRHALRRLGADYSIGGLAQLKVMHERPGHVVVAD